MRYLLLLLLLPAQFCFAQFSDFDYIFPRPGTRLVSLPEISHFDRSYIHYGYIKVENLKELHALIDTVDWKKIPAIPFDSVRLYGKSVCSQCLISCGTMRQPCHRNACQYSTHWFMIERAADTMGVAFTKIRGPDCTEATGGADTIVIRNDSTWKAVCAKCKLDTVPVVDFNAYIVLGRQGWFDCLAIFQDKVYLDADHRLHWEQYNENRGGCAGLSFFQSWIVVPRKTYAAIKFD